MSGDGGGWFDFIPDTIGGALDKGRKNFENGKWWY
jgi:hypothetical protein